MKLPLYQIDAFTDKVFGGNPACIVPLENWLPDDVLLNIANENAVAETAFFLQKNDEYHLRWFTPEIEMDLCGHATLATAHTLKNILEYDKDELVFKTLSGDLKVSFNQELITLNFPSRKPTVAELPQPIKEALSIQPKQILKARDYVLVYEQEQEIKDIEINRSIFDSINLDPGGVVVTAKGSQSHFVSRFFTPQASILEDPVTGSAHCSLIPYWAEQLGLTEMEAIQLSERQGKLFCKLQGDRVLISGQAKTYAIGSLFIEDQ